MSIATAKPISRPAAPASTDGARREGLLTFAAVAVPTVLAAALCLYEITTRSLWLDEAATVAIASQHGAAFGSALAHDGGNMLSYYALLHVLIGAFGKGALVLRLPSAIAAAATVCLVSLLALRLFDRRVAFGAGLLSAVSLSLVYWGQNARGYSLMVALIAGSFLALVTALQGERPRVAWVAYAVLTVGAVYAGLEAVLVVPAQLLVLLWYRDRIRPLAVALAISALCCVPLAVLAASRGSSQLFWVPGLSVTTVKQVVRSLASTGLQPNFYTGTGGILLVLTAIVLIVGAYRLWRLAASADGRGAAFGPSLVLAWMVIPFLLALVESALGQSIFEPRYLLVSLPAVALVLAWTALDRGIPWVVGVGLIAALLALRGAQLAPSYGRSPENWRAATSYVVARAEPRDCIAFYPLDNRQPFQYYVGTGAEAPRSILPAVPWNVVRPYVEDYATLSSSQVAALPAQCGRVLLVSSHQGEVGGPPVSRQNHNRLVALVAALKREYPRARTISFGTAKTITLTLLRR
jgi:mannosyltransferase